MKKSVVFVECVAFLKTHQVNEVANESIGMVYRVTITSKTIGSKGTFFRNSQKSFTASNPLLS